MRIFEKISFGEFQKYFGNNRELYDSYHIPRQKTVSSPGYEFELIESYMLKPQMMIRVPSGIKVEMNQNEFLMIQKNNDIGSDKNNRMYIQTSIIENRSFENTDNEGHIIIEIRNDSDTDLVLRKGEQIFQGIFLKFLRTDEEINITKL